MSKSARRKENVESGFLSLSLSSLSCIFSHLGVRFKWKLSFSCKALWVFFHSYPSVFEKVKHFRHTFGIKDEVVLTDQIVFKTLKQFPAKFTKVKSFSFDPVVRGYYFEKGLKQHETSPRVFYNPKSKELFEYIAEEDSQSFQPRLKTSKISNVLITVESIRAVFEWCPNLKTIDLRNCNFSFVNKDRHFFEIVGVKETIERLSFEQLLRFVNSSSTTSWNARPSEPSEKRNKETLVHYILGVMVGHEINKFGIHSFFRFLRPEDVPKGLKAILCDVYHSKSLRYQKESIPGFKEFSQFCTERKLHLNVQWAQDGNPQPKSVMNCFLDTAYKCQLCKRVYNVKYASDFFTCEECFRVFCAEGCFTNHFKEEKKECPACGKLFCKGCVKDFTSNYCFCVTQNCHNCAVEKDRTCSKCKYRFCKRCVEAAKKCQKCSLLYCSKCFVMNGCEVCSMYVN